MLNAYPNPLDEPVWCLLATAFSKQICAAVKCVDLEGSDDVVVDEVLCVDLRSMCFARLLVPCRVAMLLPAAGSV